MPEQFKYDAFISYRHAEADKFVAENLHKQLEAFKLPGSLAKKRKGQKNRIERVFRDKEELPLTSNLEDPIMQALQSSEWLIVICSPRLRESLWCKKEIETFVALRGREHVLAVLIEGEPADSFPDELLFRTEEVTQPDGTIKTVKIPVEPLAADVRGKTRKDMLKATKTEIMRVLAAMFGVDFDDLRQRHKERRMRRMIGASLLIGAACLLFGVYSTITALRIKEQSEQIEAQSAQILAQSDEILKQNEELKQKSEEIQKQNEAIREQNEELALRQAKTMAEEAERALNDGDRTTAIRTAVEALTESNGIALPYTPHAQQVLTESLRIYDTGDTYRAQYQYETPGRISDIRKSPDKDTLVINDTTNGLTLIDLENREVIDVIGEGNYDSWGGNTYGFLGNDRFAYKNLEDTLSVYDLQTKQVTDTVEVDYVSEFVTDTQGKYLVIEGMLGKITVFDGTTLQKLGEFDEEGSLSMGRGPFVFQEGILAKGYMNGSDLMEEDYALHFVDLNTFEVLSVFDMGEKMVQDVKIKDGVAFVLSGDYADLYADCDTYITAVAMDTGTVLWEQVQKGQFPGTLMLPGWEEATSLLCTATNSIQLLDMATGEVTHLSMSDAAVVEASAYINSNNFLLFMEDGTMSVINYDYNMLVDLSDRFDCKTTYNSYILYSKYGITVVARNDKKITVYTAEMGPDVEEVEQAQEYPQDVKALEGTAAAEVAREYGLDSPEYVSSLYFSEDERYCFLCYWDYDLVIYDVEAGKVLNTLEDVYRTEWCLGQDEEGNTYLLGYYGCYVLNQDMEVTTWIPKGRAVDFENKRVYITYNTYSYEAPLYSLEELLQIAEEQGYLSE